MEQNLFNKQLFLNLFFIFLAVDVILIFSIYYSYKVPLSKYKKFVLIYTFIYLTCCALSYFFVESAFLTIFVIFSIFRTFWLHGIYLINKERKSQADITTQTKDKE